MTRALVVTLFAVCAIGAVASGSPFRFSFTPEKNVYARRLVTEPFQIVDSMREIEPSVLAAFYKIVPRREIAVGKEPFAATDIDEGRPRRFHFAGRGSDLWFVVYEVGGLASHHSVLVFERNGGHWRYVAAAIGFPDRNDFQGFVRAVKKGRFDAVQAHDQLNL
jgi:hypothetical protein